MGPDTFEKIPPEAAGAKCVTFALHLVDARENLIGTNAVFDNGLVVSGDVEEGSAVGTFADTHNPVHNELPALALIEHDIPNPERTLGRTEVDVVALVDQERRHAAAGDKQADGFSFTHQLPQHSDVFACVDFFHATSPFTE